nr:alpha/beta hydrolase [uncultured Duganella sp.]
MPHRPLVALTALTLGLAHPCSRAAAAPAPAALAEAVCTAAGQAVDDKGFLRLGGIEQWVRIKGASCAAPVIVVVHGGPGNPNTPFADSLFKAWEKDYTIVQWDQRGAGMTFGRNPVTDDEPLVIERLRDDGVELARYVARRYGKRQVILMGGSWGSVVGLYMAKSNPELFCGYIGTAQVVDGVGQRASYDATLALARAAGDADSVARLEALGPPPWANPRNPGILRRVMRKQEARRTEPAPKAWWVIAPEYTTAKAEADYTAGEDYSWLQFVGAQGRGLNASIDMYKLGPKFDLPFYMVQGQEDLLTMPAPGKRYFDFVEAPRKEYVLVPRAGHDPNQPVLDAQYRLLKERIGDCR